MQSEYLSFGGLVENRLVFAKENAVFVPRKEAGTTASRSRSSSRSSFWRCLWLHSIIMTMAINAHYLPLVHFYAPALLASRFFLRLLRPAMLAHQIMTNPSCNFLSSDWTFVRVAQKKHPCYSIGGLDDCSRGFAYRASKDDGLRCVSRCWFDLS